MIKIRLPTKVRAARARAANWAEASVAAVLMKRAAEAAEERLEGYALAIATEAATRAAEVAAIATEAAARAAEVAAAEWERVMNCAEKALSIK